MASKQIGFTKATTGAGLTEIEVIEIIEAQGCQCETEIAEAFKDGHDLLVVDAFDIPLFVAVDAA